tara:strand:+ start:109 stop:561 length:453 start_codon:yes stop_codon:yes gene_type:complete
MTIGYIYKRTCESGLVYYGSTFSKKRNLKGWYHCACKDFKNATFEIIKTIEVKDKKELFLIENNYIINNPCINNNVAIRTSETIKAYRSKYTKENKDKLDNQRRAREEKLKHVFVNCENCGKNLNCRSLRLHKLKYCPTIRTKVSSSCNN